MVPGSTSGLRLLRLYLTFRAPTNSKCSSPDMNMAVPKFLNTCTGSAFNRFATACAKTIPSPSTTKSMSLQGLPIKRSHT